MTASGGTRVAVLATTAGSELDRTVAAFAAATSRVLIVDPLGRAAGAAVRCGAEGASDAIGDESVLAVIEGEVPTAPLADAVRATTVAARTARVVVRHVGRGWSLEPRGGMLRYGPWTTERFGLVGAAAVAPNASARLPGALVAQHGDIDTALARLDAVAGALAALLDAAGVRIGVATAAGAALGTATRALLGRAPGALGWGRWVGAVLLAYADLLAYTKVLERRGRT
jgi:hypothetical protein